MKESNLNKIKIITVKTTAATLASSILLSSCTAYPEDNMDYTDIYGEFEEPSTRSSEMINITKANLSDELAIHVANVKKVLDDILTNPERAALFIKDRNVYMQTMKFSYPLDLTEEEVNILTAFTDKEVRETMEDNDFVGFVNVCKTKGYLKNDLVQFKPISEMRQYFKSDDDYNNFINAVGYQDGPQIHPCWAVVAPVVCYIAGAVFIYGAVVTIGAFWVGVDTGVGVTQVVKKLFDKLFRTENLSLSIDNPLVLWNGEIGQAECNHLYTVMIEEQVDEIMEVLTADMQESAKSIGTKEAAKNMTAQIESTRETIKANLEGYYGIRSL